MVRVGGPNPQQIRLLTSGDVVDVSDRVARILGKVLGDEDLPLAQDVDGSLLVPVGYYTQTPYMLPDPSIAFLRVDAEGKVYVHLPLQVEILSIAVPHVKKIDLTATGIIHTPASGKQICIKGFTWSSNADIVTALRFGTGGDLLFPIQAKGVIGMNLVGYHIQGAVNEPLYGYLSGTGTMKGTVLIEEI